MKLVLYNHISMRLCTVTSFCYKKNRKFDGVQLEQIIWLFKLVRKKLQFLYYNKRKPQKPMKLLKTLSFIKMERAKTIN